MFERLFNNNPRDPFGRVDPFGMESTAGFRSLRKKREQVADSFLGDLSAGVGRGQENRREDVAKVETLMERAGGYDLNRTDGPTGIFSRGLEDSVKDFQTRSGLKTDGLIFPRGETVTALSSGKGILPREEGHEEGPGFGISFQPDDNPDVPLQKLSDEEKKPEKAEPPKQEDKKEEEPADIPPKPDKKPERTEEEHSCADIEFAYEEAKAELQSNQNLLEAARQSLKILEEDLAALKEQLAKEAKDKNIAKNIGRIGGAGIGFIIGKKPGISTGQRAGSVIGSYLEDVGDKFSGKQSDADIQSKINFIEAEIKTLQEKIPLLEAEVEKAKKLVDDAEQALKECQKA